MKNITKILFILIATFSYVAIPNNVEAATITADHLGVCAVNNGGGCIIEDNTIINIPMAGTYSVTGYISRGTEGIPECQAEEDFDLYIDGVFFVHSEDPNPCEPLGGGDVYYNESYPNVFLTAGNHNIKMLHSHRNMPADTAESVGVDLTFNSIVILPPSCTIVANPSTIDSGSSSKLTWNSENATSMTITQGIGTVGVVGNKDVSPTQTTQYRATVYGPGGSASCQTTVTVNPVAPLLPPSCTITANPSTINSGSTSNLNWTSKHATSMTITQGIGSVSLNGNRNVSPTQTTQYRATADGPGGSASCQTTVTVANTPPPVAPTCTMNANPLTINAGQSSTLSWTSTNTTSANINNEIGAVPLNGSIVVTPNITTTYLGNFNGSGGSLSCSRTITVLGASQTSGISIVKDDNDNHDDTQTISSGGTATFSITVTNTGNTNLADVTVTDALAPNCNRNFSQTLALYPGLTFDPGETFTYSCTRSGATASYTNTARVDANEIGTSATVNNTDTTAVVIGGGSTSSISIVKDDNDNHDDTQTISSGGTATFSITVTNTGSTGLNNVTVTDVLAPSCDRTAAQTASLYAGSTFDPGETFTYSCTRSGATANYTNTARTDANEISTSANVNNTDTTAVIIGGGGGTETTCTMGFTPSSVNPGDVATLYWSSTNAITASIDQGVGTVNTSGALDIFRTSSATYTGTFNGPSETVICSATVTVGGGGGGGGDTGPRITLSSGSYTTDEPSFIYLSQIPYTGVPQFLIAFFGYFFRFFFFGGALITLYKLREIKA